MSVFDFRIEIASCAHGRTAARWEWLWCELDLLSEHWDPRRHPFCERWTRGELTRGELARYAEEYDHLVCALATRSRHAATKASGVRAGDLSSHADVEEAHIDLWREFARGAGWCPESAWFYRAAPLSETIACAATWAGVGDAPIAEDLVALYAIEAQQARIAATKLCGLLEHYGFQNGAATEYHRLHAWVDESHAALMRAAFDELTCHTDPFRLLSLAGAIHRRYWYMLDALADARPA